MANKTFKISTEELQEIDSFDELYSQLTQQINSLSKFKVGDYVIAYATNEDTKTKILNTYGSARKFQVIKISQQGIPYITEISPSNNQIKPLMSMCKDFFRVQDHVQEPEHVFYTDYSERGLKIHFELDPDYLDSMILNEKYDPHYIHREKKILYNDITTYNKQIRINTKSLTDLANFLATLKPGDSIWTSNKNSYTVTDTCLISKDDIRKTQTPGSPRSKVKGPFIPLLTVVDKKNTIKKLTPDFFYRKILYTQRPRSYKELKF